MSFEIDPKNLTFYIEQAGQACNIPVKNTLHNLSTQSSTKELARVHEYDTIEPKLEPLETFVGATTSKGLRLIFWKETNEAGQEPRYAFGYSDGIDLHKVCGLVDRGNLPQCSYALFDKSYVAESVLGTLICTDEDKHRPLAMHKDPETSEQVIVLAGSVCKLVETLSAAPADSKQQKQAANEIAKLLQINPEIRTFEFRNDISFSDVAQTLARLALSGTVKTAEEKLSDSHNQAILTIATIPESQQIALTVHVPALGEVSSAADVLRLKPTEAGDDIVIIDGEARYLLGASEPATNRRILHQIAGALGLQSDYVIDPVKDRVIPGLVEVKQQAAQELVDLVGNDENWRHSRIEPESYIIKGIEKIMNGPVGHYEFAKTVPIVQDTLELNTDDINNLRKPVDLFYKMQRLVRPKTFLVPDLGGQYKKMPLMTAQGKILGSEGRVIYNEAFTGDRYTKCKLTEAVVINSTGPFEADSSTAVFGSECYKGGNPSYPVRNIVNPPYKTIENVQNDDALLIHHDPDRNIIFSLGGSKVLILLQDYKTRPRKISYASIRKWDRVQVVDTSNFDPKNYPRKIRQTLSHQVGRYNQIKSLTEANGVNFKDACEASMKHVISSLPKEVTDKISQIV